MVESDLNIIPLGDGLYKMGASGDIICTYKLLKTIVDVENNKVTYFYKKYKIEVTWTSADSGKTRENPHWQRIYF